MEGDEVEPQKEDKEREMNNVNVSGGTKSPAPQAKSKPSKRRDVRAAVSEFLRENGPSNATQIRKKVGAYWPTLINMLEAGQIKKDKKEKLYSLVK